MRLGELYWENERESVVERFKDWEKKPVDQRGPAPEINYSLSRNLFAKVLKDYPWFQQYDLALYVDGFLATEQNKSDEAFARFTRILTDFPNSRFVPDAHMARAEIYFAKPDYQTALAEYEEVLKFQDHTDLVGLALFKSAWCYWRLGNNDEATRRFVEVFKATDTTGRHVNVSQQKSLDELQERGTQVPRRGLHRGRQEHRAGHVQLPHEDPRRQVRRTNRAGARDDVFRSSPLRARHRGLRAAPEARADGARGGRLDAADRAGLQLARGLPAPQDHLRSRAREFHRRRPVGAHASRPRERRRRRARRSSRSSASTRSSSTPRRRRTRRPRRVRGRRGSVRRVSRRSSRRRRRRFRSNTTSRRSTFAASNRNTDAATHYMNAAREMPDELDKTAPGDPLKRHDAIYNAIAVARARSRRRARSAQGQGGGLRRRDRQEVRRGARRSTRSSIRTTRRSPISSSARASSITTTKSTTRR